MDLLTYMAMYGTDVTDLDLVDSIVTSGSIDDKIRLVRYADIVSPEHLIIFANDDNSDVRYCTAERYDTPVEAIEKLRLDSDKGVRVKALSHSNSDPTLFVDAVLNQKFDSRVMEQFCYSIHVATNLEAFQKLWELKKNKRSSLLSYLRTDSERNVTVDNRIFKFIDKEIMSQSAPVRVVYAACPDISNPGILDVMKTDENRTVINAVARNSNAWVSTHEYLLNKHKSPGIKESVAFATKDNDLLNKIYAKTKSEIIRKTVEDNPNFTLYK